MPGPWDRDNNRERGQIGELPLGGLLSDLLASEGVDPSEFAELSDSRFSPIPGEYVLESVPVESAAPEVEAAKLDHEMPADPPVILPGLAAQLWALSQAATANDDAWPAPEADQAEPELPLDLEAHHFALPGLLLSLTQEETAAELEPAQAPQSTAGIEHQPEPQPEPEPEPIAVAALEVPIVLDQSVLLAPDPPIEIVEAPGEDLPDIQAPLPHSRANDLSNLIGAIDSEIAAAPELPPGRAHELDKTHERFVCFRLGGISYGLHMRLVREVERIGRVTPVPGAPRLVCGLINLRGEILPLIDTRLLLDQDPAAWPPSGYLLVVQPDLEEPPLALLVDELGGVAIVDPAAVETDMAGLQASMAKHTLGMTEHRGRVVLLLDHRNLVTPEALMASAGTGGLN